MPELRETISSLIYILIFLRWCFDNNIDLTLLGLWVDATNKPSETKLAAGRVYKLDASSTAKRGSRNNQTRLYPRMWQKTKKNPDPPHLSRLVLKSASNTNRAIILDFGELVFQLAYLTHTSIQIFTRKLWKEIVQPSMKDKRGYCIGLAFEFQDHFIAFLTLDQVFQPEWALTMHELPSSPPDVYSSYSDFLFTVSNWIKQRAENSDRFGLACEAIRTKGSKVWGGVGVYTVCELFFDAGLSPFLTEAEVFDCPSRTARLCEAMWSYAHKSYKDLPDLIRPAMHQGILAPTRGQRLKYRRWLHVYAKARSVLSPRQAELWETYQKTLQNIEDNCDVQYFRKNTDLFDVFEPNHIESAFKEKELVLGSLIFGESKWLQFGFSIPYAPDPLTLMFKDRGLLLSPTYLADYNELYMEWREDINKGPPWRSTFTYRIVDSKQVWSITQSFPDNFTLQDGVANKALIHIMGPKRTTMLFKTIVSKTNRVAIGPLEYCGNGTIVRTTHSKPLVHPVRATRKEIIQHNVSKQSITKDASSESSPPDSDSGFLMLKNHDHSILSESEAYLCPDDYTSTGSFFNSEVDSDEDPIIRFRPASHSSTASDVLYSRPRSASSNYLPGTGSEMSNNTDYSGADNNINNSIIRKKKRVTYRTADREIVLNATNVGGDHAASTSSDTPQQAKRSQRSNTSNSDIFYGRKRRQYNRKK